ncbi:LexA family protein [Novosphingobium silvae]|nr:S24 family peptidase [Novosphingobium silvae]
MNAEDIKAELRRRNMSQRDLAEAVGMSENHLSKSLAGKRQFRLAEMDAIRVELAPEPDSYSIRTIPLLGSVPAGDFRPEEQRGGMRIPVSDPGTPAGAYALKVDGDSMDLIVPDGTTIIIDPDDKALWPGRRYVIQTEDGETTFKEFQADPARLVPCSSNPAHKEIPLGAAPVTVVGRVYSYTLRDVDLPRRTL